MNHRVDDASARRTSQEDPAAAIDGVPREETVLAQRSAAEFLDLLEPIRDSVYRYAARMAWGDGQSHDIVQEAVMTAWREFDRYEPNTNFKAWMFRILINSIYRLNKRVARQSGPQLDDVHHDLHSTMEREEAWSSLLDGPERLRELLDDRLVAALDRLGEDERQCLLLRLLEGFSYKDISVMLDIPMGTAMSHVHRARLKLREDLAGLAVEHGLLRESA
ncbi:MAG: sigma-70 family RNA polymerase sigma factor [Phycisphaerales bacterium]|nr:sigma-70 family RNA polymerase sigma factor [Phycisphaerales bacterium]